MMTMTKTIDWPDLKFPPINLWSMPKREDD